MRFWLSRKREVEWATNRANKKAKCTATTEKDLEAVNQQLAAKEAECKTLKEQLENIQLANVSVVEAVHNKVQESVCKVSTLINVNLNFQKWMKKHYIFYFKDVNINEVMIANCM